MKLTINVTDDDLAYGQCNSARNCPVARALINTLSARNVAVGTRSFTMEYKGQSYKGLLLPYHVEKFINDFDIGNPVEPISFEIDIDI